MIDKCLDLARELKKLCTWIVPLNLGKDIVSIKDERMN